MTATTPDDCMTSHMFWSVKGKQYTDHTFFFFFTQGPSCVLKVKKPHMYVH